MVRALLKRLGLRRESPAALRPLPNHPTQGIQVQKGDKVEITDCRISVHDRSDELSRRGHPLRARLPQESENFSSGASFALKRRLEGGRYSVDGNLVIVDSDERSLHVLLTASLSDPFPASYELAEKLLDVLSVQSFWKSELDDPLRESSTWYRSNGKTSLRYVTTAQQAVRVRMAIKAYGNDGMQREGKPPSTIRWHASFAYFRRSQLADDLHDAYRHLFLALEALLDEVYPWKAALGEGKWFESGLKYVMDGYGVALKEFVSKKSGNPYKTFLNEQYRARRCALFHSKGSRQPTLPGTLSDRAELAEATKNLGRLYVCLAKLITGVKFAGSAMSQAAFEAMMNPWESAELYVSAENDSDPKTWAAAPAILHRQVNGQLGLYQHTARWDVSGLPVRNIRRAGARFQNGGELEEAAFADVDIQLDGVDQFELVFQMELSNADQLREWYL